MDAPPHGPVREISGSLTTVLLRMVRATGGQSAVDDVITRAGCREAATRLEQVDQWVSLDQAVALLQAGTEVTGDPQFARRVGEDAIRQHAGSPVATVLRALGSPEAVLDQVTTAATKFSAVTDMRCLETGPGRAVVRSTPLPPYARHEVLCDWAKGLLSAPPELFGLPPARVIESECAAHGGSACVYEVSWDADGAARANDPEVRVSALEAQLAAMNERLQSVYATARDLVSPDDVPTVLDRIVERASREVRAPQYVLVVTPSPGQPMQVFSRGIEPAEARAVAEAVLADEQALADTLLCVRIASSRRDYGRLIARYPHGQEFFPQERLILGLYAQHAAAVLDMAVALEESARRHEHVSALLSLAHALAQAGTTAEIVQRLATALPSVVDCERASVWLWDECECCLRSAYTVGYDPVAAAEHERTVIRPSDSPMLAKMLAGPAPVFLSPDMKDGYLRALLRRLDLVASAIAPITVRDEFLGVLSVSVRERPERLREAPELIERVSGIASLAGPAIQNGRLVDELAHKATHDALTGLLNRIGFGQLFESVLSEAREDIGQVGLLFVDLDGFKDVNDLFGHDAGDDLLRLVSGRLGELIRGGDTVARLGGDEFAVILSQIRSEAEVHAVAERLRDAFSEPFFLAPDRAGIFVGVSVGEAVWPDAAQSIEALLRHADASMYRDKARAQREPAH